MAAGSGAALALPAQGSLASVYSPIAAAVPSLRAAEEPCGLRCTPGGARAAAAATVSAALLAALLWSASLVQHFAGSRAPRFSAAAGPTEHLPADPGLRSRAMMSLEAVPGHPSANAVSMFCFSMVMPKDRELMEWQLQQKASIFGCNEAAVYSNTSIHLAEGAGQGCDAQLIQGEVVCRPGRGADWYINAWLFIGRWRGVIEHGRWQYHDWTVKVDVDAVFFPQRLGFILQRHPGTTYMSSSSVKVYSPVQVLSRQALAALAEDYATSWDGKSPKRCLMEAHLLEYGDCTRDTFLDVCLSKVLLSSTRLVNERLACQADSSCQESLNCRSDRVSFYPHGTVEDYSSCMHTAVGVARRL